MKPLNRDTSNKKTSDFKKFGLLQPNSQLENKYLDEWADTWWQWAYSFDQNKHPLMDETGRLSYLGEVDNILFLGGSFNKKPITRTINVNVGKPIFFPIINILYELKPHMPCSEGMKNIYHDFNAKNLYFEINGVALDEPSKYKLMSKNCFNVTQMNTSKAISMGYWIALTSLPVGKYTISFGGEEGLFKQDITYRLKVI